MYDAKGALSEDVAYTLTPTTARGTYTLTVTADPDWINAEGRAFPVTIDPSIYMESPSADTYVSSEFPESCFGSGTTLTVGSDYVAYIDLGLPELPSGSTISEAHLYLPYINNMSTGRVSITAHRVLSSWDEYTMSYDSKASYSSTVLDSKSVSASVGSLITLDVADALSAWVSGSPNYGIALVGSSQYVGDVIVAESRELSGGDSGSPTGARIRVEYTSTIPDGVYALSTLYTSSDYENPSQTTLWMTVENASPWAGSTLQYTASSPLDATNFANESFFKITLVSEEYETYTIRSMLNNNLALSINEDWSITTKEIPSSDADVSEEDLFHIRWNGYGYEIAPFYNSSMKITANCEYSENLYLTDDISAFFLFIGG